MSPTASMFRSWDSAAADELWTAACGKERWRGMPDELAASVECVADEALWAMRGESRQRLVRERPAPADDGSSLSAAFRRRSSR